MMKRWPNRKPTDQMKGVCFLVFPLQNYLSLYIFNRRLKLFLLCLFFLTPATIPLPSLSHRPRRDTQSLTGGSFNPFPLFSSPQKACIGVASSRSIPAGSFFLSPFSFSLTFFHRMLMLRDEGKSKTPESSLSGPPLVKI